MSINNKIMDALGGQGYTGSINERIQANLLDLYGEANINVGLSKAGGFKSYVSGLIGVEYVAQTDGATQYWQLSTPIPVLSGYKVKYKFRCDGGVGNVVYIHGNSAQSSSLSSYVIPSSSQLSFSGSINEKLDGVLFTNNSTIQLGVEYEVEFEVNSNKDIATLFRLQDIEKYTAGYIYDFEILNELGAVVNKIPLTNKAQGATQVATVGSVNATMVGYDPSVWIVK